MVEWHFAKFFSEGGAGALPLGEGGGAGDGKVARVAFARALAPEGGERRRPNRNRPAKVGEPVFLKVK